MLTEKRQEEIRLKEQKERQAKYRQAGLCQHCGGEIKGLFIKKCVKCGKKKAECTCPPAEQTDDPVDTRLAILKSLLNR